MKVNQMVRPVTGAALLAMAAGLCLQAQTPAATPPASSGKVAVIEIQAAIFQTKEGQKALADLQVKFNPVKAKIDAKKAEVEKNQDALRKGQNTLSPEAQQKLARQVDVDTKALNRDTDDANNDLQEENQKLMNELGGKMYALIAKYAADKGYTVVLDVSAQSTPVVWASPSNDITRDVIAAYDASAAAGTLAPAPIRAPAVSSSRPSSGITK